MTKKKTEQLLFQLDLPLHQKQTKDQEELTHTKKQKKT